MTIDHIQLKISKATSKATSEPNIKVSKLFRSRDIARKARPEVDQIRTKISKDIGQANLENRPFSSN